MEENSRGAALVTGASSGIGLVYARRLAERGFDLVLVARSAQRLERLAAEIKKAGRRVEIIPADLTRSVDLRAVEQRLRASPAITMLVNNAGFGSTAPIADAVANDLQGMIDLNVSALTRLTHAAVPGLLQRGGGVVVNIASIVAVAPELLSGATYAATKAYVLNFTQALHNELGSRGVRFQAVLPGATRTDFWDVAGLPADRLPKGILMTAEDMVDAALRGLDLGELVTVPSLPDRADWDRLDAARRALLPNLSREHPAQRYL